MKTPDANDILRKRGPDGLRTAIDQGRVVVDLPGAGKGSTKLVTATPWRWIDPAKIPPRQWLFDRHYIRKFVTATVSAAGVGKSSLALLDAVSMASGRNLLTGAPIRPARVWYWNGEDPQEELQRRIAAIMLHYGLTEADLAGRLFVDNGRDTQIKVAIDDRQRGITINRPDVDSLEETIRQNSIDVVILDPFVSIHAVPENDNGAIDQVAKELAAVADRCNCAIETVHHVRKANGAELTAEDARGASSLIGAARSVRVINLMSLDEAAKADINPNERRLYFRIDNGKSNMAPPAAVASWRRLIGVGLGNGTSTYPEDNVGVVTAWSWPDAFKGLTSDDLKAVQNKIAGARWRENSQAKDWVGHAVAEVLDIDMDDPAAKDRVRSLLKGWLKSGALKVASGTDEKSRSRPYIEVGIWVA